MRYKKVTEFDLEKFASDNNLKMSEIAQKVGKSRQYIWRIANNQKVATEELYKSIIKLK